MAIIVAFGLMTVFFLAGLYVAGAIGSLSLIMMQVFSDAPLCNIMANRYYYRQGNRLNEGDEAVEMYLNNPLGLDLKGFVLDKMD